MQGQSSPVQVKDPMATPGGTWQLEILFLKILPFKNYIHSAEPVSVNL